jgi:hypothetical protein
MIIDLPTFENFLVTAIVTMVRTIVEASPTILGGVVVAAWLRTQATPEKIETIFCGDGIQGSLRTVLVGMTLPVCSIGILPVLRELRLLGLSTSKLITLGISAPLINPFTLLFGLTVLSFPLFLMMVAVSVSLAIVVGEVGGRFAFGGEVNSVPRPESLTGGTRMRNLLVASSRLVTGRTVVDLVVTIVFAILTIAFIRGGAFDLLCESSNQSGTGIASLLTLTQYVSPSRAIIQLGGIEDANLSTATGLGIFLCGTGIAGASILTLLQWHGWRRSLAITIAFLLFVGLISHLSKYVLTTTVIEVAETTSLDNLMRPNFASFQQIGTALNESLTFLNTFMLFGGAAVSLLAIGGIFVRLTKIGFRDDDPDVAASQNDGRMSKALPASQLGAVAIAVIGILFCASAFIFFPSPSEAIQEMDRLQLDAGLEVQTGNVNAAIDRLAAWDSAAANVPIGAAIRGSFPTSLQRELTRDLRTELRNIKILVSEGDFGSARKRLPDLKQRLTKVKDAFNKEAK